MSGELSYVPVDPPLERQQFIEQREYSAREVARVFGIPGWMLGISSGDSLTYCNTSEQMRAFHVH